MLSICPDKSEQEAKDEKYNKYLVLQGWLSHHPVTIDLKWRNQQMDISEDVLFHSKNKYVSHIEAINFLATPKYNDINPQNSNTVTKKEIYSLDAIMNSGKNILEIFPHISPEQINIFTEIIEELNKKFYNDFWINTQITQSKNESENHQDKFQIHGINCKIIDFKYGVLFVNITDIARNIWEMVEKNKEKIEDILNNQN